ncbi:MAG: FUSC family protein [Sarcina sp.]
MTNNSIIYLGAVAIAIVVFAILYKDKEIGTKYIQAFKKFFMIVMVAAIMYIYNHQYGLMIGFLCAYVGVTNFDKDFSGRFIIESIKMIAMQLLIGLAAYLCDFNKITTVIVSFIVIFLMYYLFTHKGAVSRSRGFLLTYIIILSQHVPKDNYFQIYEILFLGMLISIVFYYFFTRNSYYKDTKILDTKHLKKFFKISDFIVEADKEEEFRKNKLRHAIISTILMTAAIFYMLYFGNGESEWIIIVASAILVIDPITSEKMIIDRCLGTIIGAIIFLVAHQFITNEAIITVLIFVSVFFFVFPMAYYKRMVFITYFVLEIHLMISNYTAAYLVNYRIWFTLIAGLIVLIIVALDKHLTPRIESALKNRKNN